MPSVIELTGVTKTFGRHTVLDNVSLAVPPGVVFALLGENGAGKTTAIRLMLRREFLESMVDIAAAGRTVFLSSHQIGEVERVADIVAIMHTGRLLLVEPLEDIKRTTRQLTVTVGDANPPTPPVTSGRIIQQRHRGRQWDLIVRHIDEPALERVRFADGIIAIACR